MPSPKKPVAKKKAPVASKKKSPPAGKVNRPADGAFPAALADLLRSRKLAVPKGLQDAPPPAYAGQPVSYIEQLAAYPDGDLKVVADKIASYATRQQARSKAAWESSPLIAELRKRKLKEPPLPKRAVGVSVSLRKSLADWSDAEIVKAATEWSKRGS